MHGRLVVKTLGNYFFLGYYITHGLFVIILGGNLMANYSHLNKEQRDIIQYMISNNFSFSTISKSINKDRTTISKEIKRNRYIKSYHFEQFDFKGIKSALEKCHLLTKPPYVCNPCNNKNKCYNHKLYYNSNLAEKKYQENLISSRRGIDIDFDTVQIINKSIIPLMKLNKQSVNQVYINHADLLYFAKPTFYKYIRIGVFEMSNFDLPKKVVYKSRKKKNKTIHKRNIKILNGRKYSDYIKFTSSHPKMNITEMDTVEGPQSGRKVLLTIIIKETNFMLIRLLNKKDIISVNAAFDEIINLLGYSLFFKVFRIVLTDNGPEFLDPKHIEYNYNTGSKKGNLFYCNPYCSWQKGAIEKNHQYIRKIFKRGTSWDNFTKEQIKKLEDNINNVPRDSLGGKTPYELTLKKFPNFIKNLNCSYILPDNVNLNKSNYTK